MILANFLPRVLVMGGREEGRRVFEPPPPPFPHAKTPTKSTHPREGGEQKLPQWKSFSIHVENFWQSMVLTHKLAFSSVGPRT